MSAAARSGNVRKVTRWAGPDVPSRSEIYASIDCPFPLTLNPRASSAEAASLEWLSKLRIVVDPRQLSAFGGAHLTTLVAGFYPNAALEQLRLASDYVCWAFALDDLGDETELGGRPSRLIDIFDRFDEIFQGKAPGPSASALELGLDDVLQRVAKLTTSQQLTEFVEGNRAYFGGMLWEANNRAHAWIPDEPAYMALRPAAGAVPSFFALIEPLEGLKLEPHVRTHEDVRELAQLAGGIICWTNDVLSIEKERAHGDYHNLIMVYEQHRHLSVGEATFQAVGLINAATKDFSRLAATLPKFDPEQDRELARYVAVLRSVISATLFWTYDSTRYSDAC